MNSLYGTMARLQGPSMEPRDPQQPPAQDGPALDLGDLDWTIPPDSQPGHAGAWSNRNLGWVAARFRAAWVHGLVSTILTGLALGWWVASGKMPTSDPTIGAGALVLHIGAFVTAWLALRASVDTWQGLYDAQGSRENAPRANMTQIITILSAVVMCFHAAMVVSAMLG